jgi:cation diffusion facilitator family transporter
MTSDLAILLGARYWSQPPDSAHPYGHRRIETLVTIGIGLLLTSAGIGMGWNTIRQLRAGGEAPPGWIAFWAAIISIIIKEILYRWTFNWGKKTRSISLEANAWHHRSDALSSIPAALAVAGSVLLPTWTLLDSIGALVITIMILHVAFKIIWPCIAELLEMGASEQARDEISEIARSVEGVSDVHKVRSRFVGSRLHIDLHVLVERTMSIEDAHNIATKVTNKILSDGPHVFDVIVHIEPDTQSS